MAGMNVWTWAATAMLIALIPGGIACFRGEPEDRLVALEFNTTIIVLALLMLAQGFQRPSFFDLPLTLAVLSFGAAIVFSRFIQRWL